MPPSPSIIMHKKEVAEFIAPLLEESLLMMLLIYSYFFLNFYVHTRTQFLSYRNLWSELRHVVCLTKCYTSILMPVLSIWPQPSLLCTKCTRLRSQWTRHRENMLARLVKRAKKESRVITEIGAPVTISSENELGDYADFDLLVSNSMYYNDVIMSTMVSQITSLTIVYSTFHSCVDQRKHQSSASLAFVRGIHRWPVNSPEQMASNAENVSIWWRHHVRPRSLDHLFV